MNAHSRHRAARASRAAAAAHPSAPLVRQPALTRPQRCDSLDAKPPSRLSATARAWSLLDARRAGWLLVAALQVATPAVVVAQALPSVASNTAAASLTTPTRASSAGSTVTPVALATAQGSPAGSGTAVVANQSASPVQNASPVAAPTRSAMGQVTEVPMRRSPEPAPRRGAAVPAPTTVPAPLASDAAAAQDVMVEMHLHVGESRVLPAPGVARIAVGNGQVLTASALDKRDVLVFANAPGTSTLFIWNEHGQLQRLKLHVMANDVARLAREVQAFLASVRGVRVSSIGDKVIVEGDELSDSELLRIEQLAQRYPQIVNFTNRQGWEQMVMLDVKVVEFPVNELRELGLKWNAAGGAAVGGIWSPFNRIRGDALQIGLPGNPPITSPGNATGGSLPLTPNLLSGINLGLNATLQAMAQTGGTTILAQPQLSARNGAKASFLAGGEIPFAVSSVNGTTIQFKPYGVRLDIQPRVDRQGHVRATIETEFSQLDEANSAGGVRGLLVRRTATEFNAKAGETIVLSGLIQREKSSSVDKVPGLGDLPVLGALFRSQRFQNRETELVIFVTPTVVDPRTPALADRVNKTQERLTERLGPTPHLSEPLQPTGPAKPQAALDVPRLAALPTPEVDGPSTSDVVEAGR